MPDIKIYYGFPDGRLVMSDRGESDVYIDNTIIWRIQDESEPSTIEVVSFEIKIKTRSNDDIFSENPVMIGSEWHAKIKDDRAVIGKDCEYDIHWKDRRGNDYIYDPIISVRPSRGTPNPPIPKLFMGIIVGLLGFLTLKFLRRKKIRK